MTTTITREGPRLAVGFRYEPTIVEELKQIDRRRQWDAERKLWTLPAEGEVLRKLCNLFGLDWAGLAPDVRELYPKPPEKPAPVDLSLLDGYEFLTQPYDHQREGVAELICHNKWLLGWEPGTGKTKIAADRLRYAFLKENLTRPILIVCPRSVCTVWPRELKQHANLPSTVLLGTKKQRLEKLNTALRMHKVPILVINYEGLSVIAEALMNLRIEVCICDEAHALKNTTAQRSRLLRQLTAFATYKWCLTGTPSPNGPLDIFGICTFLDPSVIGTPNKTAFQAKYAITRKLEKSSNGYTPEIVVGYRDLDDLARRVATISSRKLKEDCLDLPPKVFVTRTCELTGDQARAYREMRVDAVTRLKTQEKAGVLSAANILTEQLRLVQIAGGHVMDDDKVQHRFKPNAKLNLLWEWIDDIPGQFLVWASFRAEITAIMDGLAERGVSALAFHGDVPDKERGDVVDRFQAGKYRAFVATPQAGGVGLTLTAADTALFYSRLFNSVHWTQAVERCHRIGQTKSVTIGILQAENTIDEKINALLEKKTTLQEMVMNGSWEEAL